MSCKILNMWETSIRDKIYFFSITYRKKMYLSHLLKIVFTIPGLILGRQNYYKTMVLTLILNLTVFYQNISREHSVSINADKSLYGRKKWLLDLVYYFLL